jgi:hypothetical protein
MQRTVMTNETSKVRTADIHRGLVSQPVAWYSCQADARPDYWPTRTTHACFPRKKDDRSCMPTSKNVCASRKVGPDLRRLSKGKRMMQAYRSAHHVLDLEPANIWLPEHTHATNWKHNCIASLAEFRQNYHTLQKGDVKQLAKGGLN